MVFTLDPRNTFLDESIYSLMRYFSPCKDTIEKQIRTQNTLTPFICFYTPFHSKNRIPRIEVFLANKKNV